VVQSLGPLGGERRDSDVTSFNLQQLNLFLRRPLTPKTTAFVDLELVNTFSSARGWGSLNLNEAWVSYRMKRSLAFKLGLHVPPFNRLNEIKNRTPLLPYVVRPVIYETSFEEILALEDYLPARAFAQVSGTLPYDQVRLSYAAYLGNSGNINNNPIFGQTGVDTTATMLVGARVGARIGPLEVGLSGTRDGTARFQALGDSLGLAPGALRNVPRTRYGGDFQLLHGPWSLDAEIVHVTFDDDQATVSLQRTFYYATLGYEPRPGWLGYVTAWSTDETGRFRGPTTGALLDQESDVDVLGAGVSFAPTERLRLKAQYSLAWIGQDERVRGIAPFFLPVPPVDVTAEAQGEIRQRTHVFGLAVSVIF
ncbi:MAG: hypothetical protein AAGG50_20375, partial [Bacteroidota bacterium]